MDKTVDKLATTLQLIRSDHPKSGELWEELVEGLKSLPGEGPGQVWCKALKDVMTIPPAMPKGAPVHYKEWNSAVVSQLKVFYDLALVKAGIKGGSDYLAPEGGTDHLVVRFDDIDAKLVQVEMKVDAIPIVAPAVAPIAAPVVAPVVVDFTALEGKVDGVAAAVTALGIGAITTAVAALQTKVDTIDLGPTDGKIDALKTALTELKTEMKKQFALDDQTRERDLSDFQVKLDELKHIITRPVDPKPIGRGWENQFYMLSSRPALPDDQQWVCILPDFPDATEGRMQYSYMRNMIVFFARRARAHPAFQALFDKDITLTQASEQKDEVKLLHHFAANKWQYWYVNKIVIEKITVLPVRGGSVPVPVQQENDDISKDILFESICPATLFVLFFQRWLIQYVAFFTGLKDWPPKWNNESWHISQISHPIFTFEIWPLQPIENGKVTFYQGVKDIVLPEEMAIDLFEYDARRRILHSNQTKSNTIGAHLLTTSNEFASLYSPPESPSGLEVHHDD